jgi:GNAT superfamily N-acetyltransferase
MILKEAHLNDSPLLSRLMEQLGYVTSESEVRAMIELYTSDPMKEVFVVKLDEVPIGCLALEILPVFHSGKKHMRIVSLVVDRPNRKKGVAGLLLAKAEELARERGCIFIELTSNERRLDAHGFYKNRGYSPHSNTLYFLKKII